MVSNEVARDARLGSAGCARSTATALLKDLSCCTAPLAASVRQAARRDGCRTSGKPGQMEATRVDLAAGNVPASVKGPRASAGIRPSGARRQRPGHRARAATTCWTGHQPVRTCSAGARRQMAARSVSRGQDVLRALIGVTVTVAVILMLLLRDAAASAAHRRSGGMVRGVVPGAEGRNSNQP